MSVFLYCFREREDILRIFEMFSGQRMMTSYFRIGGLALEPPRGWQQRVKKFIDVVPEPRRRVRRSADQQSDLDRAHARASATCRSKTCSTWASPGRCCAPPGLKMDIRKDEPYSSYEKFDFEVPTRTENDVYARYQVRMEEMRQSARIVKQALEGMPDGPWQADAPHVVLPDREKMKTQMEALIYHFKIVTEGFRVPAGEVYQVIESPRGEIGYYVVSDGTAKPYRVHMRDAELRQSAGAAADGRRHADRRLIASMGSMDFVLGDTDR